MEIFIHSPNLILGPLPTHRSVLGSWSACTSHLAIHLYIMPTCHCVVSIVELNIHSPWLCSWAQGLCHATNRAWRGDVLAHQEMHIYATSSLRATLLHPQWQSPSIQQLFEHGYTACLPKNLACTVELLHNDPCNPWMHHNWLFHSWIHTSNHHPWTTNRARS